MRVYLIAYFTSLLSMLALDAVWLGIMVRRFYAPRMSHLMAETLHWAPAAIFYLLYAAALCYLVILPALEKDAKALHVLSMGSVFGLIAYGTYDLTNQATLRNWPVTVTILDMCWGTCMTALVSLFTVMMVRRG